MLDLILLLSTLTLFFVVALHLFLQRRKLSHTTHISWLGFGCLLFSVACFFASLQLHDSEKFSRWPYQAYDDENRSRLLVVQHTPHQDLRVQSNNFVVGARIKSLMGREFFSTASLVEAMEKLTPKSIITAQVWNKLETQELIIPVAKLLRPDMSQGEAIVFALGMHGKGMVIWNLKDGAQSIGPLGMKSTRILTINDQDASSPEEWRRLLSLARDGGPIVQLLHTNADSSEQSSLVQPEVVTGSSKVMGLLFPPRLALPTKYTGTILDAALAIFATWARFLGWDETRWLDYFRHFSDFPLSWYQIASLELRSFPFWLHQLGASLAVFGGLSLGLSFGMKRGFYGKKALLASAMILTIIFIGKNSFVVCLV